MPTPQSTSLRSRSATHRTSRRALAAASLLLCTAAVACGPGKSQLLRTQAVTDLACTEPQLTTDTLIPYVESVTGCGRQDVYAWDGNLHKWISLRERAAFEMNCDKAAIEITVLDTMTYGASGCDRRVVYKFLWMSGFVANTAGNDTGGAAPPAAAPAAPAPPAAAPTDPAPPAEAPSSLTPPGPTPHAPPAPAAAN